MISQKGKCKGDCGYDDVYIVNKKHMLCSKCNYIRINGANAVIIKQKKSKLGKLSPSGKIKQKSIKQTHKDAIYSVVKRELIQELEDAEDYNCKGCGSTSNLSLSHLVRRSKDANLTASKENMTIHCLVRQDGSEGCHGRWEQIGEMTSLNDFDDNMAIIRRIDPETYWLITGKLRDAGVEIDTNLHKL